MENENITAEASENKRDEAQIISDQDSTIQHDITDLDENMGAKSASLDDLEERSEDFMRGELDVKEQMDRTSIAMIKSINGDEDPHTKDPESELEASFQATQGGLDEVFMKTDEALSKQPRKSH